MKQWSHDKPTVDGYYLFRTADESAWGWTRVLRVQAQQEFSASCVYDSENNFLGNLADFSEKCSWYPIITMEEIAKITKEKL